ncbi:hypothetical protein QUC31_007617 [Theobroma cacao]
MPPSNSYDSVSSGPERLHWNPAKECLFGLLIVIIAFMAVLLLKLSCSKPQPEPNPPSYQSEWPEQVEHKLANDVSDEVFVIMAGEQKPSRLAKPVPSSTQPCEQDESDCNHTRQGYSNFLPFYN